MEWLAGAFIEGTDFRYLTHGSYGAIFVDEQRRRARKIFFNKDGSEKSLVKNVCGDEIAAYLLAQSHDEASKLIPEFFGPIAMARILDRRGQPLDEQFIPGLGYEMEFIDGHAQKLHLAPERHHVENIFHAAGITYTADASVFRIGERIAVIDFGTFGPDPPARELADRDGLWS